MRCYRADDGKFAVRVGQGFQRAGRDEEGTNEKTYLKISCDIFTLCLKSGIRHKTNRIEIT